MHLNTIRNKFYVCFIQFYCTTLLVVIIQIVCLYPKSVQKSTIIETHLNPCYFQCFTCANIVLLEFFFVTNSALYKKTSIFYLPLIKFYIYLIFNLSLVTTDKLLCYIFNFYMHILICKQLLQTQIIYAIFFYIFDNDNKFFYKLKKKSNQIFLSSVCSLRNRFFHPIIYIKLQMDIYFKLFNIFSSKYQLS